MDALAVCVSSTPFLRDEKFTIPLILLVEVDVGAGDGNRTHVTSLEGWSSTIELHPQPSATYDTGQRAHVNPVEKPGELRVWLAGPACQAGRA